MADLSVHRLGLTFRNPIVLASGPAGTGKEILSDPEAGRVGAITLKTLTPEQRTGNPQPRLVDCPAGALNSIGLENPGCVAFVAHILPLIGALQTRRIASLASPEPARMAEMAELVGSRPEIDAIEVNLSCPNADHAAIADDIAAVRAMVGAASGASPLPVLAKLPGDSSDLLDAAAAALDAGASGLTLINAIRGMRIDHRTGRPFLHRGIGGLSGPAIFPIALARVYEARRAFPGAVIVGTGGVIDVGGVVEMLLAGADLVGIGFGFMVDPHLPARLADELERWMDRRDIPSTDALTSAAHHGGIDVRTMARTIDS